MKKRYWFLLSLTMILGILVFGLLVPAGYFKSIENHFDGELIQIYDEAQGTEDLDIDYNNDLLFISSTNRRKKEGTSTLKNGLYVLDLKDNNTYPTILRTDYNKGMYLHGISVFNQDSSTYIYAVNHLKDGDYIELFKYANDSLLHIQSFSDALMISPNDIVGISTNEFYITNDHTSKYPSQSQKEDYLRLNNRNIIHYKSRSYNEVARELAMPNGINVSPNGSILYCTTTLGHEFITYSRDTTTGALTELKKLDLDSGLDNIDVDQDGNIWIGSHPKLLDFVAHAGDASKISPSQVFKLIPGSVIGQYEVQEIYLNDGSEISASSVAVGYKNDLFIGAVFDNKVFRGRMN